MTTKTNAQTNIFNPGVANIAVSEPTGDTYSINGSNIVNKEVYVTNDNVTTTNAIPVYVRVRLVPIMRDNSGNGTGESVTINYPDLNTTNWELHGNYYYYKGILLPGHTTEYLIKKANIPAGIALDKKVEIQVIADSIQTVANAEQAAWNMKYASGTWTQVS